MAPAVLFAPFHASRLGPPRRAAAAPLAAVESPASPAGAGTAAAACGAGAPTAAAVAFGFCHAGIRSAAGAGAGACEDSGASPEVSADTSAGVGAGAGASAGAGVAAGASAGMSAGAPAGPSPSVPADSGTAGGAACALLDHGLGRLETCAVAVCSSTAPLRVDATTTVLAWPAVAVAVATAAARSVAATCWAMSASVTSPPPAASGDSFRVKSSTLIGPTAVFSICVVPA